jgi:hypothetical protein
MKIGDYKQMMAYLTRPEQPKEQVADLVDDLTPGPLKDELTKDYDPSQESYEEYLQRKALGERPFNAQDGGRANLAIGGDAIEFHRSKGVLGNLGYDFDDLSKDLKAGKTTNQIANELYEKNKNFPEKFKTDRIQKLNPVTLLESALKDRITKQPYFLKLSNKNKEVFNSKKEKALKDFNSFIENNKSKYKKMYDQNIAGAPEKFKQDLKSFLEKKYPEFIKESGGGTYITKGTKLFTPIKDLGRDITQAGDYGIEKYINNTIKESLGIPLKPKAGEGSSLDRMQRKYNLSTQQLLDAAKKQGIIPEKDPITGNPINSEDAYYRYVKRTEVDPIYNLFDKRFKFGAEHLGGISRAANIGDPQALTKITAIDPYVNRILKGSNLDKKVSTQINLAKETGNKKYLNIANDLIKQGEKDFGLKLTKYKFENNKIVPVHPKVSMDDPIIKKAERAIKSFIATGRDKTKEFELLPEELKQSVQLFKENNLPKARKFLNQAIKTGGVASVAGIVGLGLLGTEAEAAGEETRTGSILPEAAAASSLAFKPVRKIAKNFGKYALQVAGTPLGATGLIAGFGIDPKNAMDRVGIEAELALAPELVKQSAKFSPAVQKILNFGLSPAKAARAARIASPIGILSLGGEALYKYGKFVKDELDRIEKMSPEEREAYNIAEQEQMGVAAANGGLIRKGFGGGSDMGTVADSQGNVGPGAGGYQGGGTQESDDRSSAAQTAAHNSAVAAAQAANTVEEKMNILDTLNRFRPDTFVNPYNFSVDLNKNIGPFGLNSFINTLGMLGIDDPRTPEDESEQPDYGINAGYNTDLFGGTLGLGAGYNPTTGTNLGLSFYKQFSQGGRVNYNEGSLDPDILALKEKIEEIMDIEGVDFGEAFKQAMRELASQSKE